MVARLELSEHKIPQLPEPYTGYSKALWDALVNAKEQSGNLGTGPFKSPEENLQAILEKPHAIPDILLALDYWEKQRAKDPDFKIYQGYFDIFLTNHNQALYLVKCMVYLSLPLSVNEREGLEFLFQHPHLARRMASKCDQLFDMPGLTPDEQAEGIKRILAELKDELAQLRKGMTTFLIGLKPGMGVKEKDKEEKKSETNLVKFFRNNSLYDAGAKTNSYGLRLNRLPLESLILSFLTTKPQKPVHHTSDDLEKPLRRPTRRGSF